VNCRCTLRCPTLPTNAKGIPPDEAKTMTHGQITAQTKINDNFNKIATKLGDKIITELQGVDITWCKDGCIVLSAEDTLENVEKCIEKLDLEITEDRPEIKHKVRPIDPNDETKGGEEDIDEVLEPLNAGEKKKLKSRAVDNQYKIQTNG